MSEETDGLDAPMEQAFQHGMTLAGQLGTELSQTLQKFRERQAKADGAQAALMQAQFNAERTTALQALTATSNPKWWDAASRDEVAKAFEISTAWKDHTPEAAESDQHIRQEVAARYKIDTEALSLVDVPGTRKHFGSYPAEQPEISLATTQAPRVLTEVQQRIQDLQLAKDYFAQANPERLSEYRDKVQDSDLVMNYVSYQKGLIAEWRSAVGQEMPEAAKHAGERAKEEQAQALVERMEAATAQREEREEITAAKNTAPELDGPNAEDAAWFASQLDGSQESAQLAESQGHEQVAATAGNTAGVKWDSAERREALATELRSKAVPDEAITARIHAERQHARPISASVSAKAQAAKKTKAGTGQTQAHALRKQL